MKSKLILIVLFSSSLLGLTVGYYTSLPERVNTCPANNVSCLESFTISSEGETLFFVSVPLAIILFLLCFFSLSVFKTWVKFAIVYVPISALLIYSTSHTGGMFSSTREELATIVGVAFVSLSLLIITYKSWQLRKSKTRIMKTPERSLAEKRN